jgi:glycosyltransferase involved in cell wall biosynthesis
MSLDDVATLIASSDVILSPHRSEGFGLTLAEAFLAGIPALATGWSGNLDFMSDLPELLIRYRLVPVKDPYGLYRAPGLQWAEPDLEDAMGKLRTLAASSDLRHALAARGRSAVESLTSSWSHQALGRTAWADLALARRQ